MASRGRRPVLNRTSSFTVSLHFAHPRVVSRNACVHITGIIIDIVIASNCTHPAKNPESASLWTGEVSFVPERFLMVTRPYALSRAIAFTHFGGSLNTLPRDDTSRRAGKPSRDFQVFPGEGGSLPGGGAWTG